MKVLYLLIYSIGYLISLLPLRVLYVLSDMLYFPLYYIIRYRRHIVRRNLTDSFPEKNAKEIVRIEKGFYSFFCDYIVETLKQLSITHDEMRRRMTFSGTEELVRDMEAANTQFGFIYLGHYCNWEWIASMPYSFDDTVACGQIYHPLYNKFFDNLFLKMRSQYGALCIPMKETLRKIIKMKQSGKKVVIGFIADQAPKWNSIHHFTPFLNHDTPVFIGTEKLGRQMKAVIYFADVTRVKRGYYHTRLVRMTDHIEQIPEFRLTDMYMEHLEQMIRRAPQYWLWSHNRWKRTRQEWEQRMKEQEEKEKERQTT